MTGLLEREAVWHNDGHRIKVVLNRTLLDVTALPCPFDSDEDRACRHDDTPCIFGYFVDLYGAECNIGVALATPTMQVAWSLLGSRRLLDECQLWFMPVEDEAFASFLEDLAPKDV